MSDHSGLRYLFDQPNLNVRQARWLAMIREFDFEIKYIKGKENRVAYSLNRRVQVHHLTTMSSYGTDLQGRTLQARQHDVRYMEIVHRLQHSSGGGNGIGTGTDGGTSTGTFSGTGTSVGA